MGDKYHESAAEQDQVRRRNEIRRRLKGEYNRLHYNPYKLSAHVEILDPAVQRFMAMRATTYQYWKPTWGSFFWFAMTTFVPIVGFGLFLDYTRREFDKKCRSGEIPVEKRPFFM